MTLPVLDVTAPGQPLLAGDGRTVGFMDIGTNSARLVVVRIQPNRALTILTQQKEMVRLGEGEFADGLLQADAIQRCVLVCRKLVELARAYGAEEIVAIATAAAREAKNQAELVARLHREAGLDVRVISGLEEARLIFQGIASGAHIEARQALFIDIGGGSTELIVGDQNEYQALASVKVGAVRLTGLFFLPGEEEPVTPARYALIQRYVQTTAVRALQQLKAHPFELAFGSSGTIENLADIAAAALHNRRRQRDDALTYEDLQGVVALLCGLPLEERRRVPGINPGRADIIIAGAAILDYFMAALAVPEIRPSERGLREGLIVDYLARSEHGRELHGLSVRERSVLQLGRACGFDEAHARTVSALATSLFDSAAELGLHRLGEDERELLAHAATLHDIGAFLSYNDHHRHTYYLIRHVDLLGFDQTEIALMAATARFHRKGFPGRRRPELAALGRRNRRTVQVLSTLLRLAESLDRSHGGLVTQAEFQRGAEREVMLNLTARGDCQLEVWGVQSQARVFERVFGRRLTIALAASYQLALPN
jgi:exopolyphosphatase/guanosine-5'-triphosphate,3'-diphosphate pyrophosphatase